MTEDLLSEVKSLFGVNKSVSPAVKTTRVIGNEIESSVRGSKKSMS